MIPKKLFLLFSLIVACFVSPAFSGTVGILTGTVVEKGSSAPMVGVNVILTGTKMGAATDLSGNFIIRNIPAGIYTVKIMMMGYQRQIFKDVRIIADFKTTLSIELIEEAVRGEEVVVTAERPLIQPDVTSSIHFVSKSKIDQLPVTSFEEIMELQPGVSSGGHIRGGRATEVLYLIDGIIYSYVDEHTYLLTGDRHFKNKSFVILIEDES